MNAKQKTVIGVALAAVVGMGLYPPVVRPCGGYQYGWILAELLAPEYLECDEHIPDGWTWELATNRLLLQWGFVIVLAGGLVRVFKSPKALELLKDYQGATFRFKKYTAPCEDWRYDHCAGCWATFAEYDGSDVLHEGYVTSVPSDQTADESESIGHNTDVPAAVSGAGLIFVCTLTRCFNQCRDPLDFKVES